MLNKLLYSVTGRFIGDLCVDGYYYILSPVYTVLWYVFSFAIYKGIYNLTDLERYDKHMGLYIRNHRSYNEYLASSSRNLRKRLTSTLKKHFCGKRFSVTMGEQNCFYSLLFKKEFWSLTWEKCNRINDSILIAGLAHLQIYVKCVLFPFDMMTYKLNGKMVAYSCYGIKGETLILAENAIMNEYSDCMLYHHMVVTLINIAFDKGLSSVYAGFTYEHAKKMAGLTDYITTCRDKGFSNSPFKKVKICQQLTC